MTVELAQATPSRRRPPGPLTFFRTRCVLIWEGLAPTMLLAGAPVFLLVVFGLFGAWRLTPGWLHALCLVLAGAASVAILIRNLHGWRLPTRRDIQQRLERDGEARHAPLQALDDRPADAHQAHSPLWRAHLAASAERARQARLKGVRKIFDPVDPYGLRYVAIGVLYAAVVAAGDDWGARLDRIAKPQFGGESDRIAADIWIEPPAYSGRAPIYLAKAGAPPAAISEQIDAPAGSMLVAQLNGAGRKSLTFVTEDGEQDADLEERGKAASGRIALTESGVLRLRMGRSIASWPIGVIADSPPTARFVAPPMATETNLLAMTIEMADDYGVARGVLEFRLDPDQERPLDGVAFDDDALTERREISLENVAGGDGQQALELDLQSDPWAGLRVLARVAVFDGADQRGETDEIAVTLPTRNFFNPLARAVLEQRQTLAVAESEWRRVGRSFDALTLAPDAFYYDDMTDYLLLRTAFWRVMRQRADDGFEDAVEKFWPLALQLEDQALTLARQRLEAAQEALRQALENGASEDTIERLVAELRQAMNDFLEALAQYGQPAPGGDMSNAEQLDKSDLDSMLDGIQDLSQQGANNAARQLLSDLENLLNNLQLTQGGASGEGQTSGQGGQQGEEGQGGPAGRTGELIGRQRELSDEAFERGRTPGASGADLAESESGLGDSLDELIDSLGGDGARLDPNGEAGRALGQARNEMRRAEDALRGDDFDAANSAMERAIENLRDGAESLAREQMRQAQGQQGQPGDQNSGGVDPLGRPSGYADGDGVEVPEETAAGRSRAVVEELRRRLGEQGRDEEEKDYLERLLERF